MVHWMLYLGGESLGQYVCENRFLRRDRATMLIRSSFVNVREGFADLGLLVLHNHVAGTESVETSLRISSWDLLAASAIRLRLSCLPIRINSSRLSVESR